MATDDPSASGEIEALRKAAEQAVADLYSASPHEGCTWGQVGSCVYCLDHDVRLYQGDLPESRRTTPKCADDQHDWDDGDSMCQSGFYLLCLTCGEKEWTE